MIADTTEVKLRIRERFIVQITPAFKCAGLWPRSAAHWPLPQIPWPHPNLVVEVKTEGFDLLSKECIALQGKQSAMEGDAWVLSFLEAENRLLQGGKSNREPTWISYLLRCFIVRLQEEVFEHTEDFEGQAPGPAGESCYFVSHEDVAVVRMRETPARNWMGGVVHRRQDQRHLPATDLVSAVQTLSALFPAQLGSIQGEVAECVGECFETSMETDQGDADQLQVFR